jgi:hypothetical protein
MNIIIALAFLSCVGYSPNLTECVNVKGHLKSSDKLIFSQQQKILVLQGQTMLGSSWTKKGGAFSLDFCTGDGTGLPVDFYSIVQNQDTLLLASIEAFETDGDNKGNLFLPKKGAPVGVLCPKCHKADRLYTLVYVSKEQKDFESSSFKFYCSREKTKF